MRKVTGPDRGFATPNTHKRRNLDFIAFHIGCNGILVIIRDCTTVIGDDMITELEAHFVTVSSFSGVAHGHHNADPICVFPGDSGLYQRSVGNGQGNTASSLVIFSTLHCDRDKFGRTFTIAHDLVRQRLHDLIQCCLEFL
mgnify:CR=1 FL=1